MPSKQYEQHDFSLGEISPDHIWRSELQIRQRSLKTLRNTRLTVAGAAEARPGTTRLAELANGDGQVVEVTITNSVFVLVFTSFTLDVWDKAARTLVQTFGSMAWGASPHLLSVAPHGAKTYVFYNAIHPQVIERADDGTWSVSDYAFADGAGGAILQPYHRFAADGVTLTPSALSGTITLTASSAYFAASGHVGLRLRLQGREVEITSYSSSTVVGASVVQELYPTRTVTVDDTVGFEVGEIVQGKDSTAQGEVTAIPSATTLTVLMQTHTDFFYDGAATPTGEKVIGRNKVATTTAATSTTTHAAVLDWTEQAMSDLRGWPGAGAVHRNRLWMGRLENIPFGIIASAIGDFTDCEVGVNTQDAIFEEIGEVGLGIVQHFVSAEQLIVLCSKGALYYPESESNPIAPAGFELLSLGPIGSTACRPVLTAEGVLYGGAGGGSIQFAYATGDIRRSWRLAELSRLSAHMIKKPRCIAYISGAQDADTSDDGTLNHTLSYAYAVNEDSGSLAVVSYSESVADAAPGWVPWDTQGRFHWVCASDGECWAIVSHTHPGIAEVRYALEVFDPARLVDSACDIDAGDLQGPATSQTVLTPSGPMATDSVYRCAVLAGATVSLVIGGDYIGEVALNASGDFGVPDIAGDIEIGWGFDVQCVPWPPMDAEDQRARRRKRRISRVHARYQGKGMAVNGKLRSTYDAGEDTSLAGPERDELYSVPAFGWSQEPTATVSKPYAAPWLLLGISLEVAS